MSLAEWLLIGVGIGTTLAVSALAYVSGWLVARIGRVHAELIARPAPAPLTNRQNGRDVPEWRPGSAPSDSVPARPATGSRATTPGHLGRYAEPTGAPPGGDQHRGRRP